MAGNIHGGLRKSLTYAGGAVVLIVVGSSLGYWLLDRQHHSLLDCVYMSIITITTIGYGEVIDSTGRPGVRLFTMLVALGGIGTLTYVLSSITAFIVEGELRDAFRKRKMEKMAHRLEQHYIICGSSRVGQHIVQELKATTHPCVVVERDPALLQHLTQSCPDTVQIEADPTDNDSLLSAGIDRACGLFAATNDDNQNLVICLTARQLNPKLSIVASCGELKNMDKMKAAGADSVISPSFIGGLRMASEMLRPTVVSFLDVMLRDKDKNLRIEEIPVALSGRRIAELNLERHRNTLLLAIRTPTEWYYNPPRDHVLKDNSKLIIMTTPQERAQLAEELGRGPSPRI